MTSNIVEDRIDAIRAKIHEKTKHMGSAELAEYFNTSARKFIEKAGYVLTAEGILIPKPTKKAEKKTKSLSE